LIELVVRVGDVGMVWAVPHADNLPHRDPFVRDYAVPVEKGKCSCSPSRTVTQSIPAFSACCQYLIIKKYSSYVLMTGDSVGERIGSSHTHFHP
jgi:hypothetical protein